MPERTLRDILNELHERLEQADDLDSGARGALRQTADEIRGALDAAEPAQAGAGLRDRLSDAIADFEGSHPKLTESVKRLIDQLWEMGI